MISRCKNIIKFCLQCSINIIIVYITKHKNCDFDQDTFIEQSAIFTELNSL